MRRRFSIAIPGLLALAAISGCGGGGGEESTETTTATAVETTPTLSKAELIAQGDAICAEVNAAVGTVGASETDVTAQVTQDADLYGGMVESLQALGTPDEAAGYEEFAEAAEELAQAESDAQLASERGDEEALATAEGKVESALSSFQEAASAFGFQDCAEAPSAPAVPSAGGAETGAPEEAAPEEEVEAAPEEVAPEEAAPEEVAPETGGAGGTAEGGGSGAPGAEEGGGSSGGIGPG